MEATTLCLLLDRCGLYVYRKMKFSFSTSLRHTGSVDVYSHPLTSTIKNYGWLT